MAGVKVWVQEEIESENKKSWQKVYEEWQDFLREEEYKKEKELRQRNELPEVPWNQERYELNMEKWTGLKRY